MEHGLAPEYAEGLIHLQAGASRLLLCRCVRLDCCCPIACVHTQALTRGSQHQRFRTVAASCPRRRSRAHPP